MTKFLNKFKETYYKKFGSATQSFVWVSNAKPKFGKTNDPTSRRTDGRTDKWTDGRTYEQTLFQQSPGIEGWYWGADIEIIDHLETPKKFIQN